MVGNQGPVWYSLGQFSVLGKEKKSIIFCDNQKRENSSKKVLFMHIYTIVLSKHVSKWLELLLFSEMGT